MNFSKFNRVHIVACALKEELEATLDYVKGNSGYKEIIAPYLFSHIDGAIPYIAEHEDDMYIFSYTSHGRKSVVYMDALLRRCLIESSAFQTEVSVLYAGSCLGISPELRKGDVCMISDFYEYEKRDDFYQFINFASGNFPSNDFMRIVSVALTGDHFIQVANEHKEGRSGYGVLPEAARFFIEKLPVDAPHFVLDMETAYVGKLCREFVEKGYNVNFSCLRIVLDSIFDEDKIDYWKEVKNISKIIKREILHVL